MDRLVKIAEILLFIEIFLVILLLIVSYVAKIHYNHKAEKRHKNIIFLKQILSQTMAEKKMLTQEDIVFAKKNMPDLLHACEELEKNDFWPTLQRQIFLLIFRPWSLKEGKSKNWFKRYLAVQCFGHGYLKEDESYLLFFLKDKRLLIALNAAKICFAHPSAILINAVVDNLQYSRRLQRSAFSDILTSEKSDETRNFLMARLFKEENPYTKALCYELLAYFAPHPELLKKAQVYIHTNNLELQMAVMNYLSKINNTVSLKILREALHHSQWEIRAKAAKALGNFGDTDSIPFLKESIHDRAWWVRVRTAEALVKLGKNGIEVLKSQTREKDAYAFEAATEVLMKYVYNKEGQ